MLRSLFAEESTHVSTTVSCRRLTLGHAQHKRNLEPTQARQAAGTEGGGGPAFLLSVVPDVPGDLVAVPAPSSFDCVGDAPLDADGGTSGEKGSISIANQGINQI